MRNLLSQRSAPRILAGLLTIHAALLAYSAAIHSPTYDEVGHLVAGLSHWERGEFALYSVNPPLVRLWATWPVVLASPRTDWDRWMTLRDRRPEFVAGRELISLSGPESFRWLMWARWMCVPFGLLGAIVCFLWASELFGATAGLVAATLWCFSPTVLGHGQLITPDVSAASMGLAACFVFRRWLLSGRARDATFAGFVLGLALSCKSTWIIAFGLWPFLWLIWRWLDLEKPDVKRWGFEALSLAGMVGVAIYVLNSFYGFEGSFKPLGEYRFRSEALSGKQRQLTETTNGENHITSAQLAGPKRPEADRWMAGLPLPFPESFVRGIDLQKWEFERGSSSYIHGQVRTGGWWCYYLYGLALKEPVGTWCLFALACGTLTSARSKLDLRELLLLAIPALTILLLVSGQTGINKHVRYALPLLPFAFVFAGRATLMSHHSENRIVRSLPFAVLFCMVASSLTAFPHSLSYFNELVGGPSHGRFYLLNSNLSWGQDVFLLKQWRDRHPEATPFYAALHANFDPRVAGLQFSMPALRPVRSADDHSDVSAQVPLPGWYAIDANFVMGYPYQVPDGTGGRLAVHRADLTYFQCFSPVDRVGYSILIDKLTDDDVRGLVRSTDEASPGSEREATR